MMQVCSFPLLQQKGRWIRAICRYIVGAHSSEKIWFCVKLTGLSDRRTAWTTLAKIEGGLESELSFCDNLGLASLLLATFGSFNTTLRGFFLTAFEECHPVFAQNKRCFIVRCWETLVNCWCMLLPTQKLNKQRPFFEGQHIGKRESNNQTLVVMPATLAARVTFGSSRVPVPDFRRRDTQLVPSVGDLACALQNGRFADF